MVRGPRCYPTSWFLSLVLSVRCLIHVLYGIFEGEEFSANDCGTFTSEARTMVAVLWVTSLVGVIRRNPLAFSVSN